MVKHPDNEVAPRRAAEDSSSRSVINDLLVAKGGSFDYDACKRWGISSRQLARAVDRGQLLRIRPGHYVERSHWENLYPADRHLLIVRATADRLGDEVFAYQSAAAVHGIPRIDTWDSVAHAVCGRHSIERSRTSIKRHREPLDGDFTTVDRLKVTTATRTVVDLARRDSFCSALVSADHALRAKLTDRGALADMMAAMQRRHGIVAARAVIPHADSRSESVGESWSRAQMILDGFQLPDLQRDFFDSDGFITRGDFYWEELRLVGSFDGHGKYEDPAMLRGRSGYQVMRAEKAKHDRLWKIGVRDARWGWRHLRRTGGLRRLLREYGVPEVG